MHTASTWSTTTTTTASQRRLLRRLSALKTDRASLRTLNTLNTWNNTKVVNGPVGEGVQMCARTRADFLRKRHQILLKCFGRFVA